MQELKAPPSSLHSKVLLASVDVKLKLALVLLVVAGGLALMFVSGGVVSGPPPPAAVMVISLRAGVWPGTVVESTARYCI